MQNIRKLPNFEYLEARTIQEACTLLSQYADRARIVAGGTDLIPRIKRREIIPEFLIGLDGIAGLDSITYSQADGLRFGPLTTLASIEASPVVRERFNVLYQAVHSMASSQVRNLGTVGGNLCNAAPSADTAPALIAMGAWLKLVAPGSERTIPVEQFFTGPSQTVLRRGEILAEIQIPYSSLCTSGVYIKHTIRQAMDLAIVGVAVALTMRDGICQDARIALGAVAPTPVRAIEAEALLRGKSKDDRLLRAAAKEAAQECHPISDIRSSAEYRREMVEILTRRALEQSWDRCLSAGA